MINFNVSEHYFLTGFHLQTTFEVKNFSQDEIETLLSKDNSETFMSRAFQAQDAQEIM